MPSEFLGCFYCTGRSPWQLQYSSSWCYRKPKGRRWKILTGSCAQRGAIYWCWIRSTVTDECVMRLRCCFYSLALSCRFYHSEECCDFIGWRKNSPQYQRVQYQAGTAGWWTRRFHRKRCRTPCVTVHTRQSAVYTHIQSETVLGVGHYKNNTIAPMCYFLLSRNN